MDRRQRVDVVKGERDARPRRPSSTASRRAGCGRRYWCRHRAAWRRSACGFTSLSCCSSNDRSRLRQRWLSCSRRSGLFERMLGLLIMLAAVSPPISVTGVRDSYPDSLAGRPDADVPEQPVRPSGDLAGGRQASNVASAVRRWHDRHGPRDTALVPRWQQIAFAMRPAGSPDQDESEIYIMKADGSDLRRLTDSWAMTRIRTGAPTGSGSFSIHREPRRTERPNGRASGSISTAWLLTEATCDGSRTARPSAPIPYPRRTVCRSRTGE